MSLNPDLLSEIDLLLLFNSRNHLEGLKIHKDADPKKIIAAERLYELGIITLKDGGYLTARGQEAADLAESLVSILQAKAH